MQKKIFTLFLRYSFATLLLGGSTLMKMHVAWGGYVLAFSALSIFGPLTGLFLYPPALLGMMGGMHLLGYGIIPIPIKMVTYGLPTFFAALQWKLAFAQSEQCEHSTVSKWYSVADYALGIVLPLACMILFVAQPSLRPAFFYCSYWLVPIGICIVQKLFPAFLGFVMATFLTSLRSTFLAHAVGSVIWAYSIPLTAVQWNALIPVVAIERLVFALAMTFFYQAFQAAARHVQYLFLVPSFALSYVMQIHKKRLHDNR